MTVCYITTLFIYSVAIYVTHGTGFQRRRVPSVNNTSVADNHGSTGSVDKSVIFRTQHRSHRNQSTTYSIRSTPLCPERCICTIVKESVTEVYCVHSNLHAVPRDIPTSVVKVVLKHNQLKDLPGNVFINLTRLNYLDLSYNRITRVQNDSFQGLANLKFLSLAFNKLETSDAYSEDALTPLKTVQELHIEGNCNHEQRTCDYPKKVMRNITSLQTLHQDGYPARRLPVEYSSLTNLRVLVMAGQSTPGYCAIGNLSWDILRSIEHCQLTTLEMFSCHIDTIEPFTFAKFKHLTTLILASNQILCGQGLTNLTIGLNSTKIKTLILKDTCNRFPGPMEFDVMEHLTYTQLEHLDISSCNIQYIKPANILQMPTTLKYLSLRCNWINNVMFLLLVPSMPSLEILDGSFQSSFQNLEDKASMNNCRTNKTHETDSDETVVLTKTPTQHQINEAFTEDKSVLTIDRHHVDIILSVMNTSHPPWPGVIPLPLNLRIIYGSHLKLAFAIPPINFNGNNVIEEVHVSYNAFTRLQGPVSGLHMLKYLDLSHNDIKSIHEHAFSDMRNLQTLDLRSNKLGQTLKYHHPIEGSFLMNQTQLEILDMSSNGIRELPKNIFANLENIKSLNLRDNALVYLDFRLNGMKELHVLDVSYNQIKYLSATCMNMLDRISAIGPLTMDAHHNVLACSCDHQHFMTWLASNDVDFVNRSSVTCQTSNSSLITLPQLSNSVDQLQIECYTGLLLTCCITGFLFLTIVLCLVAALYNQRWKLRYMYYIGRHRMNPYHPIEEEDVVTEHDVYISFDDAFNMPSGRSVYDYVTTCLYRELEARGLRVIIREELIAGKMLHDIISSAVRKSDKVIVMLASNYCKEFWNTFEFNMAAYEGIYTKRNVIIPVLMETVDVMDMTPEIWAYCRNQEMVRFTEERADEFVDILENRIKQH